MEVNIIKKVSKVVFNDVIKRENHFAANVISDWNTLKAYNIAFEDVQKVRASYMLQDPAVWELIFRNLRTKKEKSEWEHEILKEYDRVHDVFSLSPFELYLVYVQATKNKHCIAVTLNVDCIQSFTVLLYIYHFFRVLKREYFYNLIEKRIEDESAIIKVLGRESEKNTIISKLSRTIDLYHHDG